MNWHTERLDFGVMIIVTVGQCQYALMIKDSDFRCHNDPKWLFWSAILDLKQNALREPKSQAQIYQMLEGLA